MLSADTARPARIRLATILDLAERAAVAGLLVLLCSRLIAGYRDTGQWIDLLLLASESLVVFFVIIRRTTNAVSLRPRDWAFAAIGTAGPLMVIPGGYAFLNQGGSGLLLLSGIALQLSAKFALRRSFGLVAANRGVKADGPYRFLRHPMYAGYLISHIGFLLANLSLWNLVIYVIADGMQILRIAAEERVLGDDPEYRSLCAGVRWRLIPFVY